MFPYEDSKTVSVYLSVCPYPEKRNHHSFYISNSCINRKVFTSTSTWKPETLSFFFQVAKARKNSSVRRHFPRLCFGISVAVHFSCSLSTMEATSLPAPPNKFLYLYLHHTLMRHYWLVIITWCQGKSF